MEYTLKIYLMPHAIYIKNIFIIKLYIIAYLNIYLYETLFTKE